MRRSCWGPAASIGAGRRGVRGQAGGGVGGQGGGGWGSGGMGGQASGMVVNGQAAPGGGDDLLALVQTCSIAQGALRAGAAEGPPLSIQPLPYALT